MVRIILIEGLMPIGMDFFSQEKYGHFLFGIIFVRIGISALGSIRTTKEKLMICDLRKGIIF